METFRIESDSLGEMSIPSDAYYGCQTMRGVENFAISGTPISRYPQLIHALAQVKKCAALANRELGELAPEKAEAIAAACDEILAGKLLDHFVVDAVQGGAGTSTNMNANEVICNRALELMGRQRGEYDYLHPNNDVNMAQSTNDVYPTALRIALIYKLRQLREAMRYMKHAFEEKGREFGHVIKMGRTQLQDAVPMTLGQEFTAWAVMIGEDVDRVREAAALVHEINIGGTAIGTGLNAARGYTALVTRLLARETKLPLVTASNLVEATQDTGAYVQLSGVLKRVVVKLSKICNDLRLLSSGPRCGLNEINLPPRAPGSSIMPGKVNPVIPEVVNQVCFAVIGHDITVTLAAEAGQLELNVMEPIIAMSLFNSIDMLRNACYTLADKCVRGITANEDRCREMVEGSIGLITALVPHLGYDFCSDIAKKAHRERRSVKDLLLESGRVNEEELRVLLSPEKMAAQGG